MAEQVASDGLLLPSEQPNEYKISHRWLNRGRIGMNACYSWESQAVRRPAVGCLA